MEKILVTGAAGFIGFHLVKKLLATGKYKVTGLDNINDYYDVNLKYGRLTESGISRDAISYGNTTKSSTSADYQFVYLDISDKDKLLDLFLKEKFDGVVNLAAQAGVRYSLINPGAYVESNIAGFVNILEGCRAVKVKHLVYASTSSVYGLNSKMPLKPTDSSEHQISLYAATKKANEMMAHSYSHLFGIPTTGVRFFTVYGPWGRPDMALFLFTKAMVTDEKIKVFNNGDMIRDFTYVEDIVEGITRILEKPAEPNPDWHNQEPDPSTSSAPYKIVNIGNAQPVKLMAYIEALEDAMDKKANKDFLPIQPGDVLATNADVTDLIENYHYKPSVDVKEGVAEFVKWYRHYYNV